MRCFFKRGLVSWREFLSSLGRLNFSVVLFAGKEERARSVSLPPTATKSSLLSSLAPFVNSSGGNVWLLTSSLVAVELVRNTQTHADTQRHTPTPQTPPLFCFVFFTATQAREARKQADTAGYKGTVAGTRKTTPGFRLVEKYGLLVGGCDGHRMDLSSMIMLKDNHIWSTGSITNAVKKAKSVGGFSLKIEVECQSIEEAKEAIAGGADIVMLDNFPPAKLHESAALLKKESPNVLIEGSGGITTSNLTTYFSPHVDVLSLGSLIQGAPVIDFSLKIVH
jgi:hypothetical protein